MIAALADLAELEARWNEGPALSDDERRRLIALSEGVGR